MDMINGISYHMNFLFSLRRVLFILVGSIFLLLSACSHVSPKALAESHYAYNLAANQSIENAIMLNIARAYNKESPSFLNISTITTANTLTYPSVSLTPTINPSGLGGPFFSTLASTLTGPTGSTTPTLVFTPNDGADFSEELLEPLALKYLYLVSNSETNLDHVLRIMVKSIGPFLNFRAIPSVHSANWNFNRIKQFEAFTYLMQKVFSYNGYRIYFDKQKKIPEVILPIPAGFPWAPTDLKLIKALGFATPPAKLVFMQSMGGRLPAHVIDIEPRSLLNAITFLANSVIDVDNKTPMKQPMKKIGAKFSQLLSKKLMNIYVSNQRVNNAYIEVYYDGRWFYIDNADELSKRSFEIMHIFFNATDLIPKDRALLLST